MTNCPNCGAVVNLESDKCEYCGTPYKKVNAETLCAIKDVKDGILTVNEARELLGLERLRNQQATEKLYSEAIKAMRRYTGE